MSDFMAGYHQRMNERIAWLRAYVATIEPLPEPPTPATAAELRDLARVNECIRNILDASRPPTRRERLTMHRRALWARIAQCLPYRRAHDRITGAAAIVDGLTVTD